MPQTVSTHFRFLVIAFSLALVALTAWAGEKEKPKEKKKPWEVAQGWKLEVVAAHDKEPKILYTSEVCALPDGRILAAEDPMDMVGPGKEPGDRILCFHPDGKITVFADKLYAVFGLQYIDGKVYVHHSPKLSVFTDDHGIGKDRVDLIDSDYPTPWGGGNLNDHIPAAIKLAMDGYLYMAVGDKGIFGAKSNVDGRTAELRGGGLLRIRPDGRDMEVYCTGTRNHLDVSLNAEDEMFTLDNTDDGCGWWTRVTHMVDGGYYGYPYDYRPVDSDKDALAKYKETKGANPFKPFTLWRMEEYGGGSPTGASGYMEDGLPEEFRGNLFHSEWGKGEIDRFVVERMGGSYKIVKREVLLKGGPGPFRPVGICPTTDGMGFYIGDWNYGGWANKRIVSGRLLKLTWTGKSLAAPKPAWYAAASMGQKFEATTADLIEGLKHPAQSVRLVAQRRLIDRGNDTVAPLIALLKDTKAPAHSRWHAIWALDRIGDGSTGRAAILAVLSDKNDEVSVRRQAARELGEQHASDAVPALIAELDNADASMRFRAATALGRIGDANAAAALVQHLTETDFFTHFAIFTALHKIGMKNTSAWTNIVAALGSDKKEVRDGAALVLGNAYDESLVKELCDAVAKTGVPANTRATALAILAPLEKKTAPWDGKWWATRPQLGAPPPHNTDWPGTARVTETIRAALNDADATVRLAAIEALKVAPDTGAGDALAKLFDTEKDVALLKNALRALGASKSPAALPIVKKLLQKDANAELVSDAIELARQVGGKEIVALLLEFVARPASPDSSVLALNALATLPDPQAVPVLVKLLSGSVENVAIAAAAALGGNGNNKDAIAALVAALKDSRKEVARAAAIALGASHSADAVDPLLAALSDKDLEKTARIALTVKPDVKAVDAYLDGMASKDGDIRSPCQRAIKDLRMKALPGIEARLEKNPPPMNVIADLKKTFEKDDGAQKSRIYSFDTKSLAPEAFAAFAMTHAGDAKKGEKVFKNKDIGCMKCHKVGNEGGDVGPALAGVGQKYPKTFLVESVVYPSKQILDGYHQVKFNLENGTVVSGVIRSENADEVVVADSAAALIKLKTADIKKRTEMKVSLMPESLQAQMTQDEFADLIAFLESLKDKK